MTAKIPLKNSLLLLLTAAIWGVAFVAQSVGMDYVGAFTFNSVRSIIGSLVLIPVILFLNRQKPASAQTDLQKKKTAALLLPEVYAAESVSVLQVISSSSA